MPLTHEPKSLGTPASYRIEFPDTRLLPLQGITVLAVEDSRFASDALRLLCQRSGARLRRAENLEQAMAHLRVYRPDVLLIDLGLPDGRGEGLIRRLALSGQARPVLLGMSGDPAGRGAALSAGADGFLEKPVATLAAFQKTLRAHLPGPQALPIDDGTVSADPAALHDDLALAVQALNADPGPEARQYLAGFLGGLARQSSDPALSEASLRLAAKDAALDGLTRLLGERLSGCAPFPQEMS
jgi:DNA-binding NarL/FixJ family response regulator